MNPYAFWYGVVAGQLMVILAILLRVIFSSYPPTPFITSVIGGQFIAAVLIHVLVILLDKRGKRDVHS